MQVTLNYDPTTGNLTDKNGMFIACYIGLDITDSVVTQDTVHKVTEETLLKALCITTGTKQVPE